MSRRMAALAISGLVVLLLAAYLPTAGVFGALAPPIGVVSGTRTPESSVEALPEYTNQRVITVNYTANGTAGSSGVFWTELYYRTSAEMPWVLYAPPWNPSGQWSGQLGFSTSAIITGTILFDTYFTGGEAKYEFLTVGVDRGYWTEYDVKAPSFKDTPAKARTTLDTRPPKLFVATPTPGSYTNEKVLKWLAEDEVSGVANVLVSLDGAAPDVFTEPAGSTDLALTEEGAHTAVVRAVDRAGNVAEIEDPFHYDPNAPTLQITAPQRDSFLNNRNVEVRWTAGDSGSSLAALQMSVDANPPIALALTDTSYILRDLVERGHVITLIARDLAGNLATQTIGFGVDATAPEVSLISPTADSYANVQQLQVLWTGFDAVSGVDRYRLTLDTAQVEIPSAAGYTFPGVSEGRHLVTVEAIDRAGNAAVVSARVTIDVTAPEVSLTAPAHGATVYGSGVAANWTASDAGSGLARVQLLFDNQPSVVVTGAQTHALGTIPVGPHAVTVRAWDNAGNVKEATVAFTYGGLTGGPAGGLPAIDFWILMAIIGAIAVGSAYYAVRRRKRAQA